MEKKLWENNLSNKIDKPAKQSVFNISYCKTNKKRFLFRKSVKIIIARLNTISRTFEPTNNFLIFDFFFPPNIILITVKVRGEKDERNAPISIASISVKSRIYIYVQQNVFFSLLFTYEQNGMQVFEPQKY